MKCRVCNHESDFIFQTQLLGRSVGYYECSFCSYVQTEYPTWLDDAYSSPINLTDTGILTRNLSNVQLVLSTMVLLGARKSKVVDYSGGHGILVRLLRDIGLDAFWDDPYCTNLVARGFEYHNADHISLVTAFESFEHFVSPPEELENLLSISSNILLTTDLIPSVTPPPSSWWYYGLEHGQHIGFFRASTFEFLADKYNLFYLTDGRSLHLLSRYQYSPLLWTILRKIATFYPRLLSFGLQSKTHSDYLMLCN